MNSSNAAFLKLLAENSPENMEIKVYEDLRDLPLFLPELANTSPKIVLDLRKMIGSSDTLIICTPEYVQNIPAVLKSMFEWVTASGELQNKRVIAMTLTPTEPRGAHAMQSMLNSLKGLKAHILAEVPLYKDEMGLQFPPYKASESTKLYLKEVFKLVK